MKSPSNALCLLFTVALTLPSSLHAASTMLPAGAAPRGLAFDGANVRVASSNRHTDKSPVAIVAATPPSVGSSIGVGGLSLIGLLALRRRGRGFQGSMAAKSPGPADAVTGDDAGTNLPFEDRWV